MALRDVSLRLRPVALSGERVRFKGAPEAIDTYRLFTILYMYVEGTTAGVALTAVAVRFIVRKAKSRQCCCTNGLYGYALVAARRDKRAAWVATA
jgi:hypothetical protein